MALVLDLRRTEKGYASLQEEVDALKAQLKAADTTIAKLQSSIRHTEQHHDFKDSRFPLFRKVQSKFMLSKGSRRGPTEDHSLSDLSAEQLFKKYDADDSGHIDFDEFRHFVQEMSAGQLGQMAQHAVQDAAKSAEMMAKSVFEGLNHMLPGHESRATPITLVGGVGSGYKEMLSMMAASGDGGADVPVEPLVAAVERQATLSMHLGGFMQLIVKIDEANMRTVRQSWRKHGQPASLRALLEAEAAEGVQTNGRLAEGSAALSLLWSMRMKRFWTTMADGFADTASTAPTSSFGLRAYEEEVEPYHGFMLRNTFRTALRALPSRKTMLGNMAMVPPPDAAPVWPAWEAAIAAGEGLTPDERMAACLVELRECSDATKRVTDLVQAQLDALGLRDDRKL